jgi:hypothetical protein
MAESGNMRFWEYYNPMLDFVKVLRNQIKNECKVVLPYSLDPDFIRELPS